MNENNFSQTNIALSIMETGWPAANEQQDILQLVSLCRQHDGISLSCPLDPGVPGHHFLLYGNGQLLSTLSVLPFDEETAECIAFTHPQHRHQGYFSKLLSCAMESCEFLEKCYILFPVSGTCPDTLATLNALEATLENEELQMALNLNNVVSETSDISPDFSLHYEKCADSGAAVWELTIAIHNQIFSLGSCQTLKLSGDCVCLHHVEIYPEFRGRGYGTILLRKLIRMLYTKGISRIILQVAADNTAAVSLYQKQGFLITETLSYYLY